MVFIDIILTNCKGRKKKTERRKFFGFFLNKMNDNYKKSTSKTNIIIDYIAGMTDDYFISSYEKIK